MSDNGQTALATMESGALPAKQDLDDTVARASDVAQVLKKIIDERHLSVKIGNGDHVRVEAWQTVGRFCGYAGQSEEIPTDEPGAFAKAEIIRLSDGAVVSTATARCGTPGDAPWDTRALNDQASMAQTRAIGKGFRNILSWIVVLAGYEATPAEEMPKDAAVAPGSKFWCAEHQTAWFKRGRMRGFAHPVDGESEWCNMEDAQNGPEVEDDPQSDVPPEPAGDAPVFNTAGDLLNWAKDNHEALAPAVYEALGVENQKGLQEIGIMKAYEMLVELWGEVPAD